MMTYLSIMLQYSMMNRIILTSLISLLTSTMMLCQYWQQSADYKMEITMDVDNHQYDGMQQITYVNNSPDTLDRLYYHLYFNAFQPGSMMDVRSTTIQDPDKRVGDRISNLSPEEYGWVEVSSLSIDGKPCKLLHDETILDVSLPMDILPGATVTLDMKYKAQVPLQIRRSGRDSKEGIAYSMSQWYPKLCAYDLDGWHPNPYVGREFYGNWGNFEVNVTLPGDYIIGGTGALLNPEEVGQFIDGDIVSYSPSSSSKTWKMVAKNVHDFAWGADVDYTHLRKFTKDGTQVDYYYQAEGEYETNWKNLHACMDEALQFMNARYGKYPFPRYAIIQGGDGGMEYPMATLITGERPFGSLVGVSVHEWMHSWYQMILGTDEAQYAWMDEGFTSFASSEVMNHLRGVGLIEGEAQINPIANSTIRFTEFALSGMEEPLTTYADFFKTNAAYGVGSYVKGQVYLKQLEYIIGEEAFDNTLHRYFDTWKFKHPTPSKFIRIAERESGMVLDWYNQFFVSTTATIDYEVTDISKGDDRKETKVSLKRKGDMPMPIDLLITYKDGTTEWYTIPLVMMRGEKLHSSLTVLPDWAWTNPEYTITLPTKKRKIESIQIDPTLRLADVNLENNIYPQVKIKD